MDTPLGQADCAGRVTTSKRPATRLRTWIARGKSLTDRYGPTVTLFGLLFAVVQTYQANAQGKEIREIASSVSTRYVGSFPDNMEAINHLIASTRDSLTIISDVPAYGHFSKPAMHLGYREELARLANPLRRVELEILTYDKEMRREAAIEQFGLDAGLDAVKAKDEKKWVAYFDFWDGRRREPATIDAFLDLLESEHASFLGQLEGYGIEPQRIRRRDLPVFVWISDHRRAIFSLRNYGENTREVSFQTNDPLLITILEEIAKGAFDEARPPSELPSDERSSRPAAAPAK